MSGTFVKTVLDGRLGSVENNGIRNTPFLFWTMPSLILWTDFLRSDENMLLFTWYLALSTPILRQGSNMKSSTSFKNEQNGKYLSKTCIVKNDLKKKIFEY